MILVEGGLKMLPELNNYLQRIEDLRGQVCDLIADLPAEALNWRPLPSSVPPASGGEERGGTNSLAVLATHIAGAEHFWIGEVVGGRPPTRDRDAEFAAQASDASELIRLLEDTGAETREVFATLAEAHLDGTRQVRGRTIPVRRCILHVIDHTALHLGHIQLTYQLWNRGQSKPSPFWYERWSKD
jgi:uncharacterized damage-inducible protein DinB